MKKGIFGDTFDLNKNGEIDFGEQLLELGALDTMLTCDKMIKHEKKQQKKMKKLKKLQKKRLKLQKKIKKLHSKIDWA